MQGEFRHVLSLLTIEQGESLQKVFTKEQGEC